MSFVWLIYTYGNWEDLESPLKSIPYEVYTVSNLDAGFPLGYVLGQCE